MDRANRAKRTIREARRAERRGTKHVSACLRRFGIPFVLLALAVAGIVAPLYAWDVGDGPRWKTVFEAESSFNGNVRVVEDGFSRYLMFGNTLQSGQDKRNLDRSVLRYVDGFHLGMAAVPHAKTALFIGLGGGMGPRQFHNFYPKMTVHAVDIDPIVADIARKHFKLPSDSRMKVFVGDGRAFLEKSKTKYDLIFLDAYDARSAPPMLTTVEFMRIVRSRLTPKGALVANVIAAQRGPRSRFGRSEYKTFRSVFSDTAVFPVQTRLEPDSPDNNYENMMMLGINTGKLPTTAEWRRRVKSLRRPEIRQLTILTQPGPLKSWPTADVDVLTDANPPEEDLFGE